MGLGRDPMAPVKAAVAAAAVFGLAGGAAGSGGVKVTPPQVYPGQLVRVSAAACVGPATAYSAAFNTTSARLRERTDAMRGLARISSRAAPGTYAITVRCVKGGPYDGVFVVDDPRPAAPRAGDLAAPSADNGARTAWLFGALALVVTVLGAGLALACGRPEQRDR